MNKKKSATYMAPSVNASPQNGMRTKSKKKELAVWDALVLADENRFKKEVETQKQARKKHAQEMQNYNIQYHNDRVKRERQDLQSDVKKDQEQVDRI